MYTLAIDTTAASYAIALNSEEKNIECYVEEMDFGQAEVLLPKMKSILEKHKLTIHDINLLTICVGPGSFTGVRSSISAARALGLACPEMEILGVNAFEGYIQALKERPEEIAPINAVIIETKREDFYFQAFDKHLHPITMPAATNKEEIIAQLRHSKVTFLGNGVERFLSSPTGLSLHAILNQKHLDIKDLALCGMEHYRKKEHNYPKPLYLRAPDVCLKS